MNEPRNQFPHIELKFVTDRTLSFNFFLTDKTSTTQKNRDDRWGHGGALKSSVSGIVAQWQEQLAERQQEQKPNLPKAVPLILKVDPEDFDAEELRSFGIEVIAELEDGYIIGASAESDPDLTKLQQKIEKFINSQHGGGKVAEIWEIIDLLRRPEYVLSPELQDQWEEIQDDRIYIVAVGISCIGESAELRDYPKRESYKSEDRYAEAIHRWINDRDITYQQWDELKLQRE